MGVMRQFKLWVKLWEFCLVLAISCLLLGMSARASTTLINSLEGNVGLDATGYLISVPSRQRDFFSSVNADLKTSSTGQTMNAAFEGNFMTTLGCSACTLFDARQGYLGTSPQLSSEHQVRVGRVLKTGDESWNRLDEEWALGLWQPRFRWDYLNPGLVGLAGVFYDFQQPQFQLTVFATPGFIPDRGVPYDIQDGNVNSPNPWFYAPNPQVTLMDVNTHVHYNVDGPHVGQILNHQGGGLRGRLGAQDVTKDGFWVSGAYAYKPVNQILLGYVADYSLPHDQVEVTLYPRVVYHHIGSLDFGVKAKPASAWLSFLYESPVRDSTPANWTTQELAPSFAISPTVDYQLGSSERYSPHLDFSLIRQWGGNADDQGPQKTSGASAFEVRYPYQSALKAGVHGPLPGSLGRQLKGDTHVIYDIGHEGMIISAALEYAPRRDWSLGIGADILGSAQEGQDFIGRYQHNDRVHGGVTYAF